MDDEIAKLLRELDDAIERLGRGGAGGVGGGLDEGERAELRSLVDRVEQSLTGPRGDHESVAEHLESTALHFQDDHPALAALLRSAVDTLSGYGI